MGEGQHDVALQCIEVEKSYPIQNRLKLRHVFAGRDMDGETIHALRKITMTVPRGKIVGILGKNGAGKSTLLRVLGGVYSPTRGTVKVHGKIAGLFELGGMGNPYLTGIEYTHRYLSVMGVRREDIRSVIEDIREFSELEDAFDDYIRTYSEGMKARLYFATATALQNEIYLIDELLSVGDEHFKAKCWQRMRQRLLNGASGVLVTHDWAAVLKLCEQAYVLERGRFVFSGASDQAVVTYLKIPVPDASVARFPMHNPSAYVVRSGQDASIELQVEILEPTPVDFAFSIEMLRIGVGWEVVLLSDRLPVAERPGMYTVQVSIPNLPLAKGEYSLNVFLTRRKRNPQGVEEALDKRSWTVGNGYRLLVEGEAMAPMAKLPYIARKLGEGG